MTNTITNRKKYMHDKQLIVATGARGVGKTLLAGTFAEANKESMARVFWHDSEQSANRMKAGFDRAGMPLGYYNNLGSRFSDLGETDDLLTLINKGQFPWVDGTKQSALLGYYQYVLNDIDKNLHPGKFDVYVHDTLEKFEAGMAAYVDVNKSKSGVGSIAYGKLWIDGVFPLYEAFTEALYARGVKTIILTSHLRNPWVDNKPIPGKVSPSGKKILYRLSSLMLWLVNSNENASGAPSGLVLKERMGELTVENGVWVPKKMLPERLPNCTWVEIEKYLTNGVNLENPAPGETMTPREREMISELLTDKQMELMILGEQKEIEALKNQPSVISSNIPIAVADVVESIPNVESALMNDDITKAQKAAITLYSEQNIPPMEISRLLSIPLPKILSVKKELKV